MIRFKKVGPLKVLDVWFENNTFLTTKSKIAILHSNDVIEKEKYDFSFVTYTLTLDITASQEELYKKLNRGCRGRINRAERSEINVYRTTDKEELDSFNEYQAEFCKRKHTPVVDRAELDDLEVFLARNKEGDFLGGCAFLISDDNKLVRYKYGATEHELNANEAILWKAICHYHERGFEVFDFGGCVPTEDESSYYYRNYMFKKKFGGELAESYLYYKIRGIYRIFYFGFDILVKIFFKGNVNDCVMWLNDRKLIH